MCGIFGYMGKRNVQDIVIQGLQNMEYRGYDSAGFAALFDGEFICHKTLKGVKHLNELLEENTFCTYHTALGHTRWATHGEPSLVNAHPLFDTDKTCAVVHNGIIENYIQIKKYLQSQGVQFVSETDTEVIVQLISYLYNGDITLALKEAMQQLEGSFTMAILHRDHPEKLLCAAKDKTLHLGIGDSEVFVSSDVRSFLKYTNQVLALASHEYVVIENGKAEIFDLETQIIERSLREIKYSEESLDKGSYDYYMLKEIYEQPEVLSGILEKYVDERCYGFKESFLSYIDVNFIKSIHIVACGTSYHAGLFAKYLFESFIKLPVHVETASEFRYRDPVIQEGALAILISQSGETADTLAALKELRRKSTYKIIGICNVEESTLACQVDHCLFLEAGMEVGVASTKAFTAQMLTLLLMGLKIGFLKGNILVEDLKKYLYDIRLIPAYCEELLSNNCIADVSKIFANDEHFFFLGRQLLYPIALESALKLKEIAYVDANAYPAGEMKHGPMALLSPGSPVIVFCDKDHVYEKIVGNIMEVKARKAKVIAIASYVCRDIAAVSDYQIYVPKALYSWTTPILQAIVGQLMAYYTAFSRGTEIDCPRNLAKSVTVE